MALFGSSRFESGASKYLPADYLFALLGCAGVGYALAFNWGGRGPRAFQPLVLAGLLVIWRYVALARKRATAVVATDLIWLPLIFLLLAMGWAAYEDQTLLNALLPWPNGRNAQLAMGVLVFSYIPGALGVREPRWLGHARFALLTVLVLFIGVESIKASPTPRIDVWQLQQKAVDLLRQRRNPYQELTIPDTGWGIPMPFVYPPTVIYFGFFGKWLLGDIRYSNLIAIAMTGLALRAIARRARRTSDGDGGLPALGEDAPGLIFWLQPKLFLVLEQAWVDVIQLGFLTAGLAVFLGRFRLVGVVLMGIALSSKQTMFWFLPLIFLFLNFRPRDWIALFATMALLVAPFVIWDFHALRAATLGVHGAIPPRRDALAFMAWWYAKYQVWRSTAVIAWGSSLAVLGLGAWRLRGSLTAFGLAATSIYFLFFFFQKWAFANYYYFVTGLAALSAALALHGPAAVPVAPVSPVSPVGHEPS
jgi:hypothetical protein